MKHCFSILFAFIVFHTTAQIPEMVVAPNIATVQLFQYGNQVAYPIIRLNGGDQMELHFDDLDPSIKSYYYTYQLCNADWTPAMLSQFDFIKGYSQTRITTYRVSSVAFTKYVHYQAQLPDRNSAPSRSGNYILKVFKDGDTSKLLFTKRFLVVDDKAAITAAIVQPFNSQIIRTHHKVQFRVNFSEQLNLMNYLQQTKVMILQNDRWDNAITHVRPTFFNRNVMDFDCEADAVFPAGKEWRWLDLRSFRLQSDRVANAIYSKTATEIFVKPDADRSNLRVNFFRDANGGYTIQNTESLNPYWQGDYATVHFAFAPQGGQPIRGKDLYIIGRFTNYEYNSKTKLTFNPDKGLYETSLFLKQGYYDYAYVTLDQGTQPGPKQVPDFQQTEGNYWESEDEYTILVYYKALGGRYDELVGVLKVNSLTNRTLR